MTPAELRAELQLSHADMARILGVHRHTWIKWERDEQGPPTAAARMLMTSIVYMYQHGLLDDFISWRDSAA